MKHTFAHLAKLAALLTATVAAAGCSTETGSEPEVAQDEAAVVSCGAAKYNEALAHYKNAVQWSKDRLSQGVCESDYGYQWTIADEASRAVMTCGAFRETIKSSPWAAPIREVLADSLTLASLTGELLVIKDSEWQNWTGVDAKLEGQKFWSQANGAYGSTKQIVLEKNGHARIHWVELTETDYEIHDDAATFAVEKPNGEKGKRRVIVKSGGKTEAFTLGVEAGYEYNDAPLFTLSPESATESSVKLYSLVSECDA